MNEYEKFGQELGDFLRGLLDCSSTKNIQNPSAKQGASRSEPADTTSAWNPSAKQGASRSEPADTTSAWNPSAKQGASRSEPAAITYNNPGALLKTGNLLITLQTDHSCYQVDPSSGRIEYLFTLGKPEGLFIWRVIADSQGNIYCSYSGNETGTDPIRFAKLGTQGGVLRFNHRTLAKKMPWLPEVTYLSKEKLVDPVGFQFLSNGQLLVADMSGFGGTGSIFILDNEGNKKIIAAGDPLVDPTKALMDSDGIIWIGNGNQITQDGDLIRVDPRDGSQTVVMPKRGDHQGCMVDVLQSKNPNELIIVKDNLPTLDNSSVEIFDKTSHETRILTKATPGQSRFYSLGDVVDNTLWLVESVEAQILKINLDNEVIEGTIDISGLLGAARGVVSSFEVVESVSVVPNLES